MPVSAGNLEHAERQFVAGPIEKHAQGKQGNENKARWDWRSFVISHLAGRTGELGRSDVVARQPADATAHKKNQ